MSYCGDYTSEKQRVLVVARCGNRCEAEVKVMNVWVRCFRAGVQVHHVLPRSRGGVILDNWGELYHLTGVCWSCHADIHRRLEESGGMIDGYVTTGSGGRPVYVGTDPYLSREYS